MDFNPRNIQALAGLLQEQNGDSDSEDEKPMTAMAKMTPADFGSKTEASQTSKTDANTAPEKKKDIWGEDEVKDGQEFDDVYDPRPQPEYEIIYKQAVRSEDMFLGMSNKNPSTASCEDMIVRIQLPDTRIADVELDVKDKFLDCRTPKFKLGLHLPHPVDSKNGRAQWNGDKEELSVTLQMSRDYDFVNF